jgi:hypothetical protein
LKHILRNKISYQSRKSTRKTDSAETRLVSSAVANEGKGAIALTDVISVKNQIAVSVSSAIPPDNKMPDEADCIDHSVSRLGLSVEAKDEGRTYMAPEPDNAYSVLHPVVEKTYGGPKEGRWVNVCGQVLHGSALHLSVYGSLCPCLIA